MVVAYLDVFCVCCILLYSVFVVYRCSLVTGVFMSSNGGAVLPAIVTDLLGEENLSNSVGVLNFLCAIGNLAGPPIAGNRY